MFFIESSFLLKKTKGKDLTKINKDFYSSIDNRPNYSFTSSQPVVFAFCKVNILH